MRKTVLVTGVFLAGLIMLGGQSSAHAQATETTPPAQPSQVVVEVVKGDSLSKIATKNQTTYQRVYNANEVVKNPDVIHPGEKLRIPNTDEVLPNRIAAVQPAPQSAATKRKAVQGQPKPAKQPQVQAPAVASGSVWDQLARCESGGNWSINTGNGYYGGLQFSAATWRAVGGQGLPHQNSREEQINRGKILQARSGWGQWPACTAKLGLR